MNGIPPARSFPSGCGMGRSSSGLGFFPQNRRLFPALPGGLAGRLPLGRGLGKSWKRGLENPRKRGLEIPVGLLKSICFSSRKRALEQGFFGSRDHFPNNPRFGAGFGVGSVALSPFSWFSKLENHGIKSLFPPLLRKGAFSLKNQTLGASRPAGRAGIPGVNRELLSLGCDGSRAQLQVGNRAWIEPGWGRGRDGAGSRGFPGCSRWSGHGSAAGLGWEWGSLGWKRDPLGLTSGELKINPD